MLKDLIKVKMQQRFEEKLSKLIYKINKKNLEELKVPLINKSNNQNLKVKGLMINKNPV